MKKDDFIQNLITPVMSYDMLLGVISSPKCAVKLVSTGEYCPEKGIKKIDDMNEYLCERCYENWMYSHNNSYRK